ncbi:putative [Lactococcus phage c2]|uniref:E10 protein n=1 Tax=Lactococcus phage c2 TaxID=2681624 RepID=Q38287_BPLC2|nr:hypothetical protein c2p13 [Lactococcus phage c2]AAA92170.1 putative [Lactococcus phage c2]
MIFVFLIVLIETLILWLVLERG